MMTRLLRLGQTGALDGLLLAGAASQGTFYATDYTTPLLFLADGTYLEDAARAQHLGGDQWGMTNETGSWPARRGCGSTPSGTRTSRSPPRATPMPWCGA